MIAREQEPNGKICVVHAPSLHGGVFVGAGWFTLACLGAAWLHTWGMVASIQKEVKTCSIFFSVIGIR